MERIKGVFTALITPFDKDKKIDEESLRKLVDLQIEAGISGLVPCGTTGESPTLSHEEHCRVIEIVIDQAKGRVPILAGTGSNNTSEAIYLTQKAREMGADFSLQIAPYYNKPTQDGFFEHFSRIASEVDIPIIIYNIAGRTGKNIETETIKKLSAIDNIAGVKEASGDIAQMMDVYEQTPDNFTVLSGDDNLTLPLISVGGDGVVSVVSNICPREVVKMVRSALDGDYKKARETHYELLPLFKAAFLETNPIPIKYMTSLILKCENNLRLPMTALQEENREKCRSIMKNIGVI